MKQLKDTGERIIPDFVKDGDTLTLNLLDQHLGRYEKVAQYVKGKSVLDIACGSGFGARLLKDAGACEVLGVDNDPNIIKYAQDRYAATNVRFTTADANSFTGGPFEIISCLETLEHLKEPKDFIGSLAERLQPGGIAFFSATVVETSLLYRYHLHDFTASEFRGLVEGAGFCVIDEFAQKFWASPRDVRRAMALHSDAPFPLQALSHPWKFISSMMRACFFDGLHYQNLMLIVSSQ